MVPLQRNQTPALDNARQQPVDDLFAFRPFVDVIADGDDCAARRTRIDAGEALTEQIVAAVNIRNDVGLRQGLLYRPDFRVKLDA